MKLNYIYKMVLSILALCFCCNTIYANEEKIFRIASYNVQNLFDLTNDGTEYDEYVPGSKYSWNRRVAAIKYANISRVISGLKSDIVALQEIESLKALHKLRRSLGEKRCDYPFWAISESKNSIIKCAVLSRFTVILSKELRVKSSRRSILKVVIDVYGSPLTIYINHWHSKRNPESSRMAFARVLKTEIETLSPESEYIILGDLNSDYNEFITFKKNKKLNDTAGRTGINHILKTTVNSRIVEKKMLTDDLCDKCLYNLWLELKPKDRWSYIFFNKKGSLDNIIIPKSLCDQRKIRYIENSFERFMPSYLFKGRYINRWQRTKKGVHKGVGFSDHLPVYADFKVETTESKDFPEN